MQSGSNTVMLMQMARWGLPIVPQVITHIQHGTGLMYMDGNGLRFVDRYGQERLNITWEQFDRGPDV